MIPVFIVNFNRFLLPKGIVEYLTPDTGCEPIIVDNNSSYPPLLAWYDTKPCKIHRLSSNQGNCVVWGKNNGIDLFKEHDCSRGYIVTDSDLDLSRIPKDFLRVLQAGLDRFGEGATKIGFSLEINDLPNTQIGKEARGWEQMNWEERSPGYCQAPVDTTFALYRWMPHNPCLAHDFNKSWRTQRPYTARHMPWYYTKETIPEDELYYLRTISRNFTHYSNLMRQMIGA